MVLRIIVFVRGVSATKILPWQWIQQHPRASEETRGLIYEGKKLRVEKYKDAVSWSGFVCIATKKTGICNVACARHFTSREMKFSSCESACLLMSEVKPTVGSLYSGW